MIENNKIYNEDCRDTMSRMGNGQVDIVLSSPFYNTNDKAGTKGTLVNCKVNKGCYPYVRYDMFTDCMADEQYEKFTLALFREFGRILADNGVVLWQISYGSKGADALLRLLSAITVATEFSCADVIAWKKSACMPNSCSPNKASRITEFVFVFCRKKEFYTFNSNKRVVSERKNGQKQYSCFYNFVEARNNDGSCSLNKAAYSSELCEKLLSLYAKEGQVIYDPFMGTGTTAVACKRMKLNFIGSEISPRQVQYSLERLSKEN